MTPGKMSHGIVTSLAILSTAIIASAESTTFVGCLYEPLCQPSEYCVNDHVFGQCLDVNDDSESLIKLSPTHDQLVELNNVVERLLFQGHSWQHIYTQCVLQTHLLILSTGVEHDASVCELANDQSPLLPRGSRAVPALPDDNNADQLSDYLFYDSSGSAHYTPANEQQLVVSPDVEDNQPTVFSKEPSGIYGFIPGDSNINSDINTYNDVNVENIFLKNLNQDNSEAGRDSAVHGVSDGFVPESREQVSLRRVPAQNDRKWSSHPTKQTINDLVALKHLDVPKAMMKRSVPPSIDFGQDGASPIDFDENVAPSIDFVETLYDPIEYRNTPQDQTMADISRSPSVGLLENGGENNKHNSLDYDSFSFKGVGDGTAKTSIAAEIFPTSHDWMSSASNKNSLRELNSAIVSAHNIDPLVNSFPNGFDTSEFNTVFTPETGWSILTRVNSDQENSRLKNSDKNRFEKLNTGSSLDLDLIDLPSYSWIMATPNSVEFGHRQGLDESQQREELENSFSQLSTDENQFNDVDLPTQLSGIHKTININDERLEEKIFQEAIDNLLGNSSKQQENHSGIEMESNDRSESKNGHLIPLTSEPILYPIISEARRYQHERKPLSGAAIISSTQYGHANEEGDDDQALLPAVEHSSDGLQSSDHDANYQPVLPFTRNERLDTKKPGPWYGINNFAFDYDFDGDISKIPTKQQASSVSSLPIPYVSQSSSIHNGWEDDSSPNNSSGLQKIKKVIQKSEQAHFASRNSNGEKLRAEEHITPEYNKKFFQTETLSENTGSVILLSIGQKLNGTESVEHIVKGIVKLLHLKPELLTNIRYVSNIVIFNVQGVTSNAENVISKIEANRGLIREKLGIDVLSIFQQSKSSGEISVSSSPIGNIDQSYLAPLAIVLSALAALVVFLSLVLFVFCRKRRGSGKKLKKPNDSVGISGDRCGKKTEQDVKHHYQELCRSRMATKRNDKNESPLKERSARMPALCRDPDGVMQSTTSRASSSSWSEEPVISNMDISTGHMVLSFMEDHLNNKDKLDKEWKSLEAYEAEPSVASVATQASNKVKIRAKAPPPYDHNRVVLNPVTNADSGDFINASTITDHDPRNPAYIITQGVLSETVNDFWQMVWEQGCVVIVMLTRLTESGTVMCHRYWPEEGSELYHIYEVHLVSEHIWCDEYLVRSFYLKNQKTAETRTVTQFHFLAWPDQSVPSSVKALLEFRRKVNKSYRGRSCPMIVQCCDGAGRAGTYCLIDMVLNRMAKGVKEIDLTATLEHVRDQRAAAVGTQQQFEFVLMAIAEEVHAIINAMPQ